MIIPKCIYNWCDVKIDEYNQYSINNIIGMIDNLKHGTMILPISNEGVEIVDIDIDKNK